MQQANKTIEKNIFIAKQLIIDNKNMSHTGETYKKVKYVRCDGPNCLCGNCSGCFHSSCLVEMADGTNKSVEFIKSGDYVKTPNGIAKVLVKVQFNKKFPTITKMCIFSGGLIITPYHPIKIKDEWVFPENIDAIDHYEFTDGSIYNFILDIDSEHIIIVNGIQCCTFGHNIHDNDVIEHEFLGSNKIIGELMKNPGYNDGHIIFDTNPFRRDPESGMICGLI